MTTTHTIANTFALHSKAFPALHIQNSLGISLPLFPGRKLSARLQAVPLPRDSQQTLGAGAGAGGGAGVALAAAVVGRCTFHLENEFSVAVPRAGASIIRPGPILPRRLDEKEVTRKDGYWAAYIIRAGESTSIEASHGLHHQFLKAELVDNPRGASGGTIMPIAFHQFI